MAHILHIKRQDAAGMGDAITLEEWRTAVDHVDGVRMAKGDAAATNPLTAQVVILPNRGGDVEVFRKDCDRWLRALFWTPDGTVRFVAPDMPEDPIVPLACKLADELGARVLGEEGEAYE